MSTLNRKPIKQLEGRKGSALSRLIKCYVCNQHCQSQQSFELHLKQHQDKLNRINVEEIQRKTQESFRTKKQDPLNRTISSKVPLEKVEQKNEVKKQSFQKDVQDLEKADITQEEYERQIEDALKESQILLEKIEFITQIAPLNDISDPQNQEDTPILIEKNISNERQLFNLINSSNNPNIESLILATNFENKIFENYQEQLLHLRTLASAAINPSSIAKIIDIRKKICRDVWEELTVLCKKQEEVKRVKLVKKNPNLGQSDGALKYCADCFSPIQGGAGLFSLPCGHSYHQECWEGECCG